jgi:cell division protein FtsA
MFNDDNIVVGLEIGTHKICAAVGEMNADGSVNIIGMGQARSNGVRKGEICDPEKVEIELRTAIDVAEKMADAELRNVFLGVSGGHVRGFNNRGNHTVLSSEHEISEDDVQDVIRNAKAINLAAEDTVIHAVRQHFYVDGHEYLASPVGVCGSQLAVDMHVIHGKATRFQNAVRLVRATQLEVNEIVFNGLASALALLTGEQKEIGALVIDIGAGTTEYVVYADNAIRFSGVLAVGGDHVTNDIAFGVKIALSRAETLKLEHGSAVVRSEAKGQVINVTSDIGQVIKSVNVEHLQRIMALRLEEMFQIILGELEKAGLTDYLRAGIFLTGGGSLVPGIEALAERIFQMNVTRGHAAGIGGITTALDQPEFSTALGLVKYGSMKTHQRAGRRGLVNRVQDLVGRFWLRD